MQILEQISQSLQAGAANKAKSLTQQAVNEGIPVQTILNDGLIAGMNIVGVKFKNNEMFLPEVLTVARAMKAGMEVLKPLLAAAKVKSRGRIAIGTVKGDIHDIGKNLVCIMLEGAGYDVIDMGIDVPQETFVEFVRTEKPDVLGMSALLTTTMNRMKFVIEALEVNQLRDTVKIIVGGAPISKNFAAEIRADGYARDAASAVDVVKGLLDGKMIAAG
jgi:5-methyltetrahydrofolate--homocysteine methyltransferase